jgi:PAS domain S-box-containing protein
LLALLEHVTQLAVLFVDEQTRVVDMNHGARLLLALGPEDLPRLDLAAIFPTFSEEKCRAALRRAAAEERYTTETWCARGDGTRFRGDVLLTPAHGRDGAAREFVLVLRDASQRHMEHERERRRLQQSIAVSAFAQRATRELTAEAVAAATVEHVALAMQADYVELLEPVSGNEKVLVATHTFGARGIEEAIEVEPAAPLIYAEAVAQRDPVLRELRDEDFAHAPHLRRLGMRCAAVLAIRAGDRTCVLGAFSKSPIAEADLHPLRSIAATCEAVTARRIAERQLAERDRTVTMILDQLPAVLATLDRDLRFTSVRGAGLRAFGERYDVVGYTLGQVSASDAPAHATFAAALRGESSAFNAVWQGRYYENRVEPLRDHDGQIVGVMNLAVDMTDRVKNEEALSASREELRRLSARLTQLQEEERRRIAHELHDELGQRLTALRIEASLLPLKLGPRGTRAATDAIASMLELIDETIVTVRRVSTELRPPILDDFGFRAALELELATLQKRTGIGFEIHFAPDDLEVDRERATTLYRIVQESLTNVVRHSGATFVRVSLEQHGEAIVLEVADNGRGIKAAELSGRPSLGLVGIRERAHAHGGAAEIRTRDAGGTVVSVRLPSGGAS